jgi:hypothetical protein
MYKKKLMDNQSNCSNQSNVSVSIWGEEMDLEVAVDKIFKQIQEHLNELHCQIRQLCQSEDRNDDYDEALEHYEAITLHTKEGVAVMKDLPKVMKQILPPKPKNWVSKKLCAITE